MLITKQTKIILESKENCECNRDWLYRDASYKAPEKCLWIGDELELSSEWRERWEKAFQVKKNSQWERPQIAVKMDTRGTEGETTWQKHWADDP